MNLVAELGEADHTDIDVDRDTPDTPIDIYAFGRNFIEDCDDESDSDEGYVLITAGMSDRLMSTPATAEDESAAIELVWYVRELNQSYFETLRWLAKLPHIDRTWFGMGHTVPMPRPPLPFSDFQTFLFLPPIIQTDQDIFRDLTSHGESIATLCVHLVSSEEYELIKTPEGLDQFLDMLDENDYPLVFDPKRKSML